MKLLEQEAKEILEEKLKNGGSLQVAAQGDIPTVKRTLEKYLEIGIPAVLGPCSAGG